MQGEFRKAGHLDNFSQCQRKICHYNVFEKNIVHV